MSIDDYRPQFMVEAVYDLKPDQLREHGKIGRAHV